MEKTFSPKFDHSISVEAAKTIIKTGNKDNPRAAAVTKSELMQILNQPGCIGIKIYVNKAAPEVNPVIVGINAQGEELGLKILGYLPTNTSWNLPDSHTNTIS
jgi:hypothetical protein